MEDPATGRIGEHHDAYRKGVVLGLTMAEAGILIIFVLLLLIAFGQMRQEALSEQFLGRRPVDPARLRELETKETTLASIANELGVDSADPDEFARRLVRI